MPGAIDDLRSEISAVDTGVNVQKESTGLETEVMKKFKEAMSEEEPFISRALGGRTDGTGYFELYPHKISEYTAAPKEDITTLTDRVSVAAEKHKVKLGPELTLKLKGFATQWADASGTQTTQIAAVDISRAVRSTARQTVEMWCMKALGMITYTFPGDDATAKSLCDFSLLYPAHHQTVFNTSVKPGQTATPVERNFKAGAYIKVTVQNAATVRLSLSSAKNEDQNTPQEVAGNTTTAISIDTFAANLTLDHFIVVTNLSTANTAEVKIELA